MKIKMIVVDLDGTLLRDDKTISQYTLDALRKCREMGVKVVYATGRGPTADTVAPVHLFDARIQLTGARVYAEDGIVFNHLIPYRLSRSFISACIGRGMKIYAQLDGTDYANFNVSDVWADTINFKIVDLLQHDQDAEKLCLPIENPSDEAFIKEHLPRELNAFFSRFSDVMIMYKEATKAATIAELAGMWGIESGEVVVFGDDAIDIDMLRYAGTGVAMGNALDAVKTVADRTTLSNEEDGIAVWICNHILKEKH